MRVQFDRFVLDSETRELRLGGDRVPLSPKAFDLLTILIADPGAECEAGRDGQAGQLADRRHHVDVFATGAYPGLVRERPVRYEQNELAAGVLLPRVRCRERD